MSCHRLASLVTGLVLLAAVFSTPAVRPAAACPFCSAISLTFGEEINGSDVAVIAKLVELPPEAKEGNSLAGSDIKAKFEVVDVLKGEKALGKTRKFEALYFGKQPVGSLMLVLGVEPPNVNWSTPIALSERGRDYLLQSIGLPKEGPERLAFFQKFLEDDDEMLARDAYDEFAKTPYAGLKEIKGIMDHDKIVSWVQDTKIPPSRRNLYWMMLGICGRPEDIPLFEERIRSDDKQVKSNALLASYLTLRGPEGLKLLEDLFLKNQKSDYVDTYATVLAVRFHGQEETVIPRPRLIEALRYMLDRPQLADLVIPDLGRWEDWGVMDRLVELFKTADDKSIWVRVPVISYLRACPLPKAKQYIDELAKIDPESVKRASSFFPLAPAKPEPTMADDKPAGKGSDSAAPATGSDPGHEHGSGRQNGPGRENGARRQEGLGQAIGPRRRQARTANKPAVVAEADETAQVEPGAEEATAGDSDLAAADETENDAAVPAMAAQRVDSQSVARMPPRLSRSEAPVSKLPHVGMWQVLGGMALACAVLGIFLVAILRGGQEAAS